MTTRTIWLFVGLLVAGTLWLLAGAVHTITGRTPATSTSWYSGPGDNVVIRP